MTGRADYFAPGDWNAVCYECGRKRKASTLKKHWQGYYVCPEHWEPRQPQDFVRSVPDVQTPPWAQPMPANSFVPVAYTLTLTDSTTLTDGVAFVINLGPIARIINARVNGAPVNAMALNGGANTSFSAGLFVESVSAVEVITKSVVHIITDSSTVGESMVPMLSTSSTRSVDGVTLNAVSLG